MRRETACFSIYSDISSRMRASGVWNRSLANCLTSSVLPTPVAPTKRKETGLCLGEIPTRFRRMAAVTASTASSWPMICSLSRSSSLDSRSNSLSSMRLAGIPVHCSTTLARFSTVSSGLGNALRDWMASSTWMILLRSMATWAYCW